MYTDPIADFLTRIRNAQSAGHKIVEIPASRLKVDITRVLEEQGFIRKFKHVERKPQGVLKIALKYDKESKRPAITHIKRISKPGLRKYTGAASMPNTLNGLGIAIVSTPKGVMTAKQAQGQNVGGEIICEVY